MGVKLSVLGPTVAAWFCTLKLLDGKRQVKSRSHLSTLPFKVFHGFLWNPRKYMLGQGCYPTWKTWRTWKSQGIGYFTKKSGKSQGISSFYSKTWKSQGIWKKITTWNNFHANFKTKVKYICGVKQKFFLKWSGKSQGILFCCLNSNPV